MTHIGLIYCAYATKDYLARSLAPWVALRKAGQVKVSICAVNVLFKGFEGEDDGTRELLRGYLDRGDIDHLVDSPDGIPETEARGAALTWLRDTAKVDLTWMVDSDEMYEPEHIAFILDALPANPWAAWVKLSFKNYVFDTHTYLKDPFVPPRIHRMRPKPGLLAHRFIADNDISYITESTGTEWPQSALASATIPDFLVWIPHITWQNDLRAKVKCLYQARRWGAQTCSFSWDDSKGGLIFNPALPTPKTIQEP